MARLDPSLIRGFDLFRDVDDGALRQVLADATTRRVAKGETLFEQGGAADDFFVLLDGRLKIAQVTPDGEQILIRFVVPGEVCGVAVVLHRSDYPATATAVVDSLALAWRSAHWDTLCMVAPALVRNTLHTVGQRLQEAHSRICEISTEEVERRVAHTLLRLSGQSGRRADAGILIDFPVTRQDLADMTGATLHTVSRIMSAWEGARLIEGGRQRIILRDPHKLLLLAEGKPAPP